MQSRKVFIAVSDSNLLKILKTSLKKAGYSVVGEARDGHAALRMIRTLDPDVVLLDDGLSGENSFEVAQIIEEDRIAPVVLLSDGIQKDFIEMAKDYWVFAFIFKPVEEINLVPAIETAAANFYRLMKLENEVAELKETLETRKLVEKAKGILMNTMQISESEAFRRIQQESMNKSMTMKELANAIILSDGLLSN